jgi:hypothetical protein
MPKPKCIEAHKDRGENSEASQPWADAEVKPRANPQPARETEET